MYQEAGGSVESFCQLLNNLHNYSFSSIHFVHGQNNETCDECEMYYWNVLHNLLCEEDCPDYVKCTRLNFAKRGYRGMNFYAHNISQGSCELLLALMWLVASDILEENIDKMLNNMLDVIDPHSLNHQPDQKVESLNSGDKINYTMAQFEKLHLSHKSFLLYIQEKSKLLTKIEEKAGDKTHFLNKLDALIYSDDQDIISNSIKRSSAVLNSYYIWKSQEKQFFKWIKAVQNRKAKEDKQIVDINQISKAEEVKKLIGEKIRIKTVSDIKKSYKDDEITPTSENLQNWAANIMGSFDLGTL